MLINMEEITEIEEVINSLKDEKNATSDVVNKLTDALFAVRSIQTG